MRFSLSCALLGVVASLSGGALAQDVTYPFEDQPAAKTAQPAKPKAAKPAAAKPAAATPAVPLPKEAVRPEAKPETKKEAKAEPQTSADAKPAAKPEAKQPDIKIEAKLSTPPLPGVAEDERAKIGFSVVTDPITGVQLGLPTKWVPKSAPGQNGTRWSSRHGDILVETFRIKTTESLNALFEKQKREPGNRKVESSGVKGDGFTVTGLQGLKKFGVRAQLKNGELRGYTVMFDQMMEGIVAPVTAAMAGSFAPFPDAVAPIAALAKPVDYGSGVIVSAEGHILTDRRHADNCNVISVAGLGNADRVAVDAANGLALIRIYGKNGLRPASLASESPNGELTLAGIPDPQMQNGAATLAEFKAQISGNAIRLRDSAPIAGLSGAAALDAKGRVAGIMEARTMQLASVEPSLPPVRFVAAAAIRDFLGAHAVPLQQESNDSRAAIVRVICIRKP